ncbi:TPA: hypothetical protein DCZ31_04785 [Patescibacteria group bacterium]|nr:hypothetical protein [Candidatus Gracilibacteria bacterium]
MSSIFVPGNSGNHLRALKSITSSLKLSSKRYNSPLITETSAFSLNSTFWLLQIVIRAYDHSPTLYFILTDEIPEYTTFSA